MSGSGVPQKRVIAYVDGFNLYFGLKDSGWQRYYWLDVQKLIENILPPDTTLAGVKYFTSRVVSPEDKRKRQGDYLEALQTVTGCQMLFGKYQFETFFCQSCYQTQDIPKEKMTDVNIAVEMMADAFEARFDIALLVSGDSDLTPPVAAVRRLFPEKRVIIAFPPKRHSSDLEKAASSSFIIARTKFRDSQLPEEVTKPDSYVLKRPERWR
jgi:uncharacterized LabA/DUF88 family protein